MYITLPWNLPVCKATHSNSDDQFILNNLNKHNLSEQRLRFPCMAGGCGLVPRHHCCSLVIGGSAVIDFNQLCSHGRTSAKT